MTHIDRRLAVMQRVLAAYRVPLMDTLAEACTVGVSVFAGQARPKEMIEPGEPHYAQFFRADNRYFALGNSYVCWQAGWRRWLEAWKPEVLICEANPRYLTTRLAAQWMRQRRRRVIGWGLGAPPSTGLRNTLRHMFLAHFDALVTYSEQGKAQYVTLGFPAEKVFVAPNAAAPRPTWSMPERPAAFATGRASLLFVGRLQARKRLDVLLRACAALPQHLQPDLTIVGDGAIRAELEALAGEVYPRTIFTGALYGEAVIPYFTRADMLVLPGTGGLALQQALGYGLPLIAGEADGTQVDIVRPANGWQVAGGDVDALTATLVEALSNPQRLREMGAESYRMAVEEVNLERMVAVFADAVRAVEDADA
jgi:glycosyltransferase involved in cell wall biosynthesis